MKKSTADHMHRKCRKNNLVWLFALLGILVLFLGTILAFLIFSELSSKPAETVREVSAVNVEKDIPETDMGDLIYHEPAAENVVMQGGFGYVNNELLVTLDSSDSLYALKEYLAGIGGEVVGEIPLTADYQIMLSGTYSEEELEALTEQVKSLPYVERSSLNYAFELEEDSYQYYSNDPKWDDWESTGGNNWNMKAIDAPGAWAYRNQMGPVNVGVIDRCFDADHVDLNFSEEPYNNDDGTNSDMSHSTHVAGIIGAEFNNKIGICGVSPNTNIYGAAHIGNLAAYKTALNYLIVEKKCKVINISMGMPDDCIFSAGNGDVELKRDLDRLNQELAECLKDLKDHLMEFVICKSAGNSNEYSFFKRDDDDTENPLYINFNDYQKYMAGTYPANEKSDWDKKYERYIGKVLESDCISKKEDVDARYSIFSGIEDSEVESMIIVVGSAAVSGKHSYFGCKHDGYRVASYSNRGSRVDVLAPGGDNESTKFPDAQIYSTIPGGYGYLYGTSMAAPHVAGVAAMIFGIDPSFTAKEVKDIIKSTATGSYGEEGYKMLNAKLAVEKAIELRNQKAKKEENSSDDPTERHKYEIFRETLTWEEAKAACEAKGGHLATITSPEEQKLIESLNTQNSKLWIGGYKNSAGEWCWVTGEPWEYQNWGDGEPNNSSNVVADESCVAVWPEKWNDLANGNIYEQSGYICEWEATNDESTVEEDGYAGYIYEFYTLPESEWESGPITWQQAERRCEWKGGHLAVIESSTENFLLYSAMKAKGYENAYFGFSDESSEGNWKWVDGTSTAYTNWHSGEPNNQDGIEHYAMFYEKFQDGTWNDADGIIDAGCAYICEWDDPTDKISQGDSFTDQQLRIIAKDLGVPDDLNVEIKQYPKTYWKAAGLWDIYVEVLLDGKVIASGSFDVETGEMGRNIYIYTPV